VQAVKQGGVESEELVLADLAAWLEAEWEPDARYVFGPGSTLHGLAQNLGLETTLLGVDVIEAGQVIAHDVNESELFGLVDERPTYLLVTAIGGRAISSAVATSRSARACYAPWAWSACAWWRPSASWRRWKGDRCWSTVVT